MSEAGEFYRHGTQYGSTYSPTPEAMMDLYDDFYNGGWQIFAGSAIRRSDGVASYGDNGYFNEIYGADIMAGMMQCKNTYTAIGSRPYDHIGVRIAPEHADVGLDENGNFQGIGYQTVQDGKIPESKFMPVFELAEPYKEVPFSWDYGLGLMAVEGKDDVSSHKQYAKMIAETYAHNINLAILRPIGCKQPTAVRNGDWTSKSDMTPAGATVETSLQGIARMISSHEEINKTNRGVTITEDMVSPYGGKKGDLYDFRSAKTTNFDGNLVDADGGTMDLDYLDSLWRLCVPGWDDMGNVNNKMWAISQLAEQKIAAQFRARNLYLDSVSVQRTFAGVKTFPGREGGILMNSYLNIPLMPDYDIAYNWATQRPLATEMGDLFLLDTNHIWMGMLTPVSVYTVDNIAITRQLLEKSVIHARMETRIDKFIGHGRITNVSVGA